MKIEILGTRGKVEPCAPKYEKHTGILIDDKILIDVGEPEFLENKPEAILFTHFHPDHAFFVYNEDAFTPKIPHFGPEKHELIPELEVMTQKTTILGYDFTPIPVIHALNLKSWGYVVEKGNKKVFFTGDVAWIEKTYLKQINQVDLIVTEATIFEKGGRINRKDNKIYGHTGIPDLVRILGPLTSRMVFTHYGDWFFEDVETNLKKLKEFSSKELEIIPAHDGYKITV